MPERLASHCASPPSSFLLPSTTFRLEPDVLP
jgi:hypothetical protein